ncbi:MAG: hypothetical protein OXQ28_12505 [Acidobacteriota bacterium]|nr:hypothetical protein [Acidobacteriota bacterium]
MAKRERAARRGHTWDPWPCCEAEVEERKWYAGRPKREHVCPDCRELIELGKDARRRSSAAGEATYKWTDRHHAWPAYYGAYHFERRPIARADDAFDAGDQLRRRMFELVNTISRPAGGQPWSSKAPAVLTCTERSRRVSPYEEEVLVTMDPKVRTAVDAFDAAVREALESAYAEGKKRGQSILLNLAGDKLTVNEFNRRTAEGAE